jgi:hypothetical protein
VAFHRFGNTDSVLFALLPLLVPPPTFEDATASLGLSLSNSAACWVDLNNDGWTDLVAEDVWMNLEGKSFKKGPNVGTVVAADFDNDGFADLFSWSRLQLHRNKGDGTFAQVTLPTLPKTISRGACWGDFNGDGFVDLYVGGYEDWETQTTYPDLVLMNKEGKQFEIASTNATYRARGVTAADFDQDGDIDVYVSNYRLQPNLLLVNDGKGLFADMAKEKNAIATSEGFRGGHSIGAAWGDFDDDGKIDLFAGNFAHVDSRGDQPKSRFYRNLGDKFEDKGPSGVFYQESYASPAAGDYDNDGDLDLFFTTVYATASFGVKNNPVLFRNDGGFRFVDDTLRAGLADLGATYQAAWCDFDKDGDLDLASNGKLYRNKGGQDNWLQVRLIGDGKAINKLAIGAQVRISVGEKTLTRQVEAGTGEGNQNDLVLHFGLGKEKGEITLQVVWPGGKRQTLKGVKPNQRITVAAESGQRS